MAKRKYPSELNTRTVRVNLNTWLLLKELATSAGKTMAELLDQLITGEDHKAPVSPAQIRLPVTMAEVTPATMAEVTPTFIAQVPIKSPSIQLRATVAGRRSTNGSQQM